MRTIAAEPATTRAYAFGEGLRLSPDGCSLLWVDLHAGRLHRAPLPDLDDVTTLADLGMPLGAAAPCEDGFVLAAGRGLALLRHDGTVRDLATLEPEGNRLNDAACDLQGRLWAGSMAVDESDGRGSLWRVDLDGRAEQVLIGVSIGNGPAVSPDGRTLYLDDSGRAVTLAYDLDPGTGALSGERLVARHDRGVGDGLTVADDGTLWVALFGGSGVHALSPAGELLVRVEVGASRVSSVCLAGGRLFCTTVAQGTSGEPDAGRLFTAEVGASAPPVRPFLGRLP